MTTKSLTLKSQNLKLILQEHNQLHQVGENMSGTQKFKETKSLIQSLTFTNNRMEKFLGFAKNFQID